MKKFLLIPLILLLLLASCGEEEEISFQAYFDLDQVEKVDQLFSPKKTPKIPFPYNKIYDPFMFRDSAVAKAIFEKGNTNKLVVIVLDSIETTMNVAIRKKKEKLVKGIPVIIHNKASRKNNTLLLHRGGAILIQEAKNKKGEWVEIERVTQEKIGNFYYRIRPKEYVYTKVPQYKGTFETTLRVKLFTGETSFIYSNEYPGMIQSWML